MPASSPVSIFSHHVDATASLSDHLNSVGIAHEIVGLPDSVTSALQAQFEMLCYAASGGTADPIRRGRASSSRALSVGSTLHRPPA